MPGGAVFWPPSSAPAGFSPPVARDADEYAPRPEPEVPPQLTGMAARVWATFYNHGQPSRAEIADCLRVTEQFQAEALAGLAPQVRYPVAPKVWAGTWGAFGAGLGIVAATSLLDAVDVIPSVFPGQPWTASVVALLTIVGPPVASFLRAYGAAHQARPADSVVLAPGSEVGAQGDGGEQVQR